jgi:putative CocE/NonD family hydrolase
MVVVLAAVTLPGAVTRPASAQSYGVVVDRDVMIPMRDGARLATDVYRPARNGAPATGRFPVLMDRTPYNKDGSAATADYFVSNGYVVIAQDVRGRYRSEGRWRPIRDDPNDGFDTAAWIAAQPWSSGKLGTMGTSYAGATQHALAIAHPPSLVTMIPVDAMSNFGQYGVRHNGAFELRWFNWVFTLGNAAGTRNDTIAARRATSDPSHAGDLVEMGKHVRDYVMQLPLTAGATPLRFAPDYEAWLIEAMSHGDYDDFWKNHGASVVDHLAEYKDMPIQHVTGSYDSWGTQVANMNYVRLSATKRSRQHLIIGPWTHGGQTRAYAGEAQFTPDAALDFNAWRLRWFDHWLKGTDNGVDRDAPVRIYVMGGGDAHRTPEGRLFVGGHWRDEHEWPLARIAHTPYYLHADRSLAMARPPASSAPMRYRFDPKHPVPTLGGNVSSQGALMVQGAADQRCRHDWWLCTDDQPLSARPDVLVFQTPPLDRDIEVTGSVVVKLWAASDATDTDFTAKLVDVYPPNGDYPNGVDLNVADGIVRARYRKGPGTAELLMPGKPYELTIETYPTSLVFKRGHRIRVDISSSNFPRFDVNPNTGEPLNKNTRWQVATNSIYDDAAHPSRIILPIVPARERSVTVP